MAPINKILGCYFILQFKEVLIVKFTLGRSPSEGKGYSLYYSGLENSMDCIVHGVAKSRTRLSDVQFTTWKSSTNAARSLDT